MLEMVAATSVVVGCIFLLRAAVVRFGVGPFSRNGNTRIRVVESVALGAKQQLHLVEVDGRSLLLGASESGIARLARLPDAKPVDAARGGASSTSDPRAAAPGRPKILRVLKTGLGALVPFASRPGFRYRAE